MKKTTYHILIRHSREVPDLYEYLELHDNRLFYNLAVDNQGWDDINEANKIFDEIDTQFLKSYPFNVFKKTTSATLYLRRRRIDIKFDVHNDVLSEKVIV